MKFSKIGTSIVESMVVMLIVVTGVIWMYNIFTKSQRVSDSSSNRVQAIAIAREWIEALTNIRDTNWLIYSANNTNCWNTFNYNWWCIITDVDIPAGSYRLYKNTTNNRWMIDAVSVTWTGGYKNNAYKNAFEIRNDSKGFYTQQTGTGTSFSPLFTREIKISYPSDAGTPTQKMNIESIVRWWDSARANGFYEINLQTTLTNWK